MPTFLHVGCGAKRKDRTTPGFASALWSELRFDIDPLVKPDIVGSMIDMSAVATASMDALFSSHNIEHLYPHEVPQALSEFRRVLKPDGFVVITCPDLQGVATLIANDGLADAAYQSPAGPITPLDILYGHRASLASGRLYMAHRTGFTRKLLMQELLGAGFATVVANRRPAPYFELWALATVTAISEDSLRALATAHFPA